MHSRLVRHLKHIQLPSLHRLPDATELGQTRVLLVQLLEEALHLHVVVVCEVCCGNTVDVVTLAPFMHWRFARLSLF